MPDAAFGSTETISLKEELVAAVVQRELLEASKLAPRFMNVSSFCVPGARTIDFPKAGHLTIIDRAEGTAGDAAAITYSVDTLSLAFNAYVAWIVDYKSKVQSKIDVQLDLAGRAARKHANYLDSKLALELEAAGDATTTAGAISYAIMVEMMETFMTRVGDLSGASWVVGPDSWGALAQLDEFKRADVYGSSMIPSGSVGKALGVDVIVSNQIGTTTFYLTDREALAYGVQAGPSYSEQGANEFGSQAKRAVLDQIFGVKAMLVNQEGAGASESALIIKDNN